MSARGTIHRVTDPAQLEVAICVATFYEDLAERLVNGAVEAFHEGGVEPDSVQTFEVPGAPLEIRWALGPRHHWAFTSTALTSKLWGFFRKDDGSFEAVEVATIGDPKSPPLPVDISLSADDRFLFVDSFLDGTVRVYDVADPRKPRKIHERKIGSQVNMVSQSWDGKRVYFTSSLLANWDKTGADDEQFLRGFDWNGQALAKRFEVDFAAEKLGRPHIMNLGSTAFYQGRVAQAAP